MLGVTLLSIGSDKDCNLLSMTRGEAWHRMPWTVDSVDNVALVLGSFHCGSRTSCSKHMEEVDPQHGRNMDPCYTMRTAKRGNDNRAVSHPLVDAVVGAQRLTGSGGRLQAPLVCSWRHEARRRQTDAEANHMTCVSRVAAHESVRIC